ncbi:13944_t:CDS:2 [Acaulospora colombiana]|uniref:13944_t:CDS:1 n=1 Tax=Acaulospora colombiana TaxID=27376 RepID=A0ACA9KM83_9GLOM|nr:13944_t:CDS:2 [Acaulospora colombiana]
MGVREAEERETLEIKSRHEVDTTRLIDPVSSSQQRKEKTTSPSSPEKSRHPSKINHTTASASVVSPTKKSRKSSATTSTRSPSALFSCSYLIIIILVVTVLLLGVTLDSFLHHQKDPIGCEVSYMYPEYIKQVGFDSEQTRFAGKYGLYLYKDLSYDRGDQPIGIPALFIPGNAGSYRQVRSIASETSKLYYGNRSELWNNGLRSIDFFTVDFNEELSAFHGHSLLEQAEYINDAIRYILSLYPLVRKNQQTGPSLQVYPDPTSVIIIGHSMGGVVARTLFTMPNYQPGSINTILTMSSPHLLPPAPFDWQISKIYTDINDFWRNGYFQNSTRNSLEDVTLISIAGGNLDTVVCSDSANISPLVPASHGFTVFTTSIPNVWTAMDHQCILWCDQLVGVVANSLLSVVDIRRAEQTKPRPERMLAFRKVLLGGFDEPAEGGHYEPKRGSFGIINLEKLPHRFLDMGERLVLNNSESIPRVYLMSIPPSAPHSALNAFSLLTDQSLSEGSGLDILLCHVMPTEAAFFTPAIAPHMKRGIELQFWTDPTCSAPLSVDIVLDWYGSFGKMVMRFQTVLAAFPFVTIMMTLRAQLREYNNGEPFPSFVYGLSLFVRQTLPKLLVAVSVLSIYQSIAVFPKTYSLAELFIMDYVPEDLRKIVMDRAPLNV